MSARARRPALRFLGRLTLALLAVAVTCHPASAQIINATWTGTSSNWNDASIWSSSPFFPNNGVPTGTEYNVQLQGGGMISLNVPITIDHLGLTSGTIGATGGTANSLTMTTGLNWTGGTIVGTINAITSGLTLPGGPQVPVLDMATLTLTGSSFWSGGNFLMQNGATLVNSAGGGILTATGNGTINLGQGTATFNNFGQFVKTAATGTTTIAVPVTNTGTMTAQSGTLQFNSSLTNSGTLLASGGSIQVTGSLNNLSASGILTGGTYQVQANSTLALPATSIITTIEPNTTVELDGANSSIPALASLNTVNGTLNLGAGATLTLNNPTKVGGTLNVAAGATLNGMQPLSVASTATLAVQGTINTPVTTAGILSGNAHFGGNVTVLPSGRISPGNSAGTITIGGNMTFNGSYDWDLVANSNLQPGTAFDTVTVTGTTSLDPPAVNAKIGSGVDFTNAFWSTPQQWPILTSGGGFSANSVLPALGQDTTGFQASHPAGQFSLVMQPNALVLMWDPGQSVQQFTWNGAADSNWSNSGNWNTGTVPVSAIGTQLIFGATANAVMTNDVANPFILNSMTFNAGSPAYTLNGNGLDFRTNGAFPAQIVSNSANSVTITAPVSLTNNLMVSGTGGLTLSGGISGSGSLTLTGPGTLTLAGGNTYSGGTIISGGTLTLASDSALGTGPLTLGASGTLSYTATTASNRAMNVGGGTLAVAAGATVTLNGVLSGAGSLTKAGTGTLTLTAANNYSGGTMINSGTVAVNGDAALGSGPVTFGANGTLSYTGSTSTARMFNLGSSGTLAVAAGQTLTLNGNSVTGGYLNGPGTIATSAANGATLDGVTTRPSVTLASNSGADTYINVTNGGAFNIAANINPNAPVTLNGFTNQGSGSITVGGGSQVNAADFQSYGTLTLSFGSPGIPTQLTNTGTSPLFFNGGSRTFISIPSHAGQFDAGIDLFGKSAVVAGGLFVNNGYVVDSGPTGTKTVIADFGSLVKGAGFYQNSVQTINGGKFQSGNSPGTSSFGTFTFGPGGVTNYQWQINDPGPSPTFPSAPGIAGGTSSVTGSPDFGWSLIKAIKVGPSPGNFTWTATAASPLTVILQTLTGQTTVGNDVLGPMQNFDNSHAYSLQFVTWAGNYTGPTDSATLNSETIFDQSSGPFANTIPPGATFGWTVKFNSGTSGPGELDLTYTPVVPEPGALSLTGLAGLAAGWVIRRRRT
jgi:autotransporter-associated beta strand protein